MLAVFLVCKIRHWVSQLSTSASALFFLQWVSMMPHPTPVNYWMMALSTLFQTTAVSRIRCQNNYYSTCESEFPSKEWTAGLFVEWWATFVDIYDNCIIKKWPTPKPIFRFWFFRLNPTWRFGFVCWNLSQRRIVCPCLVHFMFQVVANERSIGNHIPVFCVKIISDQCYGL